MGIKRHPPSAELWRFCIERLRELRGPDVRERELGNILGFEHSRAVRWKEGQMYVDSAEYLLRLSEALAVDTMVLVDIVADGLDAKGAHERIAREGRKEVKAATRRAAKFGLLSEGPTSRRVTDAPLVLGILADPAPFRAAVEADPRLDGVATTNLLVGVATAEAWRPEIVLLDWELAGDHGATACRVISTLKLNSPVGRCRVVVAAKTQGDDVFVAARVVGASGLVALPINGEEVAEELRWVGRRG